MSARPHSALVVHEPVENPRTYSEALIGYSAQCLACQEAEEQKR